MLIYFKVGNYKSIKEPLTLNFLASSISEHNNSNVITADKAAVLKSLLLYGHNASGKSKILDAFIFFKKFITDSAIRNQGDGAIDVEPFRLNEMTMKKPSFFEAGFLLDTIRYRYGFEANKDKIHKEWLLETKAQKEYPVFLRIKDEFEISENRFENAKGLEKRTRSNALFLSVASQWNVAKAELINKWFSSIFTASGLTDSRAFKDLTVEMLSNPKYSKLIHEFIRKADLGIAAIDVAELPLEIPEIDRRLSPDVKELFLQNMKAEQGKSVITHHYRFDKKNNVVGTEMFLLDKQGSEGTRKYFSLIGLILTALYENRLIVMDEFDARLHTALSKAILKLFNSSKIKSKGQLLVASHDTALLDKNILRRDQIYFVEKDKYGASHTTSLVEYKVRKEAPYDRNYLQGRYGAIPLIDDLETLVANG